MFFGQSSEITARNSQARDDIGFALRTYADAICVKVHFLPSCDQADVECQVLLRQFRAEPVQDAGKFKSRAITINIIEYQGTVSRDAGHFQFPTIGRPPGYDTHILAIFNRKPLKIERYVGCLAGCDQRRTCDVDGVASVLLIPRHMDFYAGVLQRARGLHCAQG